MPLVPGDVIGLMERLCQKRCGEQILELCLSPECIGPHDPDSASSEDTGNQSKIDRIGGRALPYVACVHPAKHFEHRRLLEWQAGMIIEHGIHGTDDIRGWPPEHYADLMRIEGHTRGLEQDPGGTGVRPPKILKDLEAV